MKNKNRQYFHVKGAQYLALSTESTTAADKRNEH